MTTRVNNFLTSNLRDRDINVKITIGNDYGNLPEVLRCPRGDQSRSRIQQVE